MILPPRTLRPHPLLVSAIVSERRGHGPNGPDGPSSCPFVPISGTTVSSRRDVDVHVVAVLEHGPVARRVPGVVDPPPRRRAVPRRPDPLVEDDVVDVEPSC